MENETEYEIRYTSDGWRVEWQRSDGCVAYWFGTLEECRERAEYKPEDCWWVASDNDKIRMFDL